MSVGTAVAVFDASTIARRLAPVLGDEKADAAVRDAMRELGFSERSLTREEQTKVLDWLADRPGLTGTAARRAKHGMELRENAVARPFGAPQTGRMSIPTKVVAPPPPAPASNMLEGAELVAIFARALGDEKARETIDGECRRLNINPKRFSLPEAHTLLDQLAATGGLVAVTARFAKARLSLRR